MTDPRPANTPWLTPYLTVRDGRAAVNFYRQAFGFETGHLHEEDGQVLHAELLYKGGLLVMLAPEGAWDSPCQAPATLGVIAPQSFYVYVDDVDAAYDRAVAAGAKPGQAPADMFWGDRYCSVSDPDGFVWALARHLSPSS